MKPEKNLRLHLFLLLLITVNSLKFQSQVVINEIAVKPNPDATNSCVQSLKECSNSTCGSEYVEFYNNSDCSIDMSCYIFITESFDGARDGAFRFPSGTLIPARGFISIGGPNSGATFNLYDYCATSYLLTANSRWYLENGDAWCALYSSTGSLVDAVFWTANAAESGKWPGDTDLDDTPPYIPSGSASLCPTVTTLSRPAATVGTGVLQIEYAGENPNLGTVLERTVDGGTTWATDAAGTLNACNGACIPIGSGVSASAASSSPSVCLNQSIGIITHSTAGVTSIANDGVSGANGLPLGVSATYSSNTITITGSSSTPGTYNYSIALSGACSGSTATGTIIINPNNSVSGPGGASLCINTALTAITHTTIGATGISNDGISGANGLPAGVSASWSSNTISISGTPTVSGTFNYSIPLTGGCGSVSATGTITVNPTLTSTTNITICQTQLPYSWNGLTFSAAGSQTATLSSVVTGCDSLATLNLTVTNTPFIPLVSDDTIICLGEEINPLTVTGGNGTFVWYSNNTLTDTLAYGSSYQPLESQIGTYTLYVTEIQDNCESLAAEISYTIESCRLILGSAFTPNGDGDNDVWELPNVDELYPNNVVYIYNRWGTLLFQSQSGNYSSSPWNGTYKGNALPVASYYFIIDPAEGDKVKITGTVSIILNN